MRHSYQRRVWVVVAGLAFATLVVIARLFQFQILEARQLSANGDELRNYSATRLPVRGAILDRNGIMLAAPGNDFEVDASPALLIREQMDDIATSLAPVLEKSRYQILDTIETAKAEALPWVTLARRVSPELADRIEALPYAGLYLEPVPRRLYPQGNLLSHALGYVNFEGEGLSGLERYYQDLLGGRAATEQRSGDPAALRTNLPVVDGADIVLTVDRTVQYVVEQHLEQALKQYGAQSGLIIAMQPRTGEILAMASRPDFSPYNYPDFPVEVLTNPAVSLQYEPGSVMKLATVAAALDSGVATPQTSFVDSGVFEVGGITVRNSCRCGYGLVDVTTILKESINTGTTFLSTLMGPDIFYNYLGRFGFGRPTGIDLAAEFRGEVHLPDSPVWSDSFLGTNSFGQGIAVTAVQMISAASAIANRGVQMQPHLVKEIRYADGRVEVIEPQVMSLPIRPETADAMLPMTILSGELASFDGYVVAGKSGTAQIPEAGGYHPTDTIASYIGWLPADDPQLIILVKLDRPQTSEWGSQTATPTFAALAQDLVLLLDIPPDPVRLGQMITP